MGETKQTKKMKLDIISILLLAIQCVCQDGYENNANIPLDDVGLLHDIFGTGTFDYEVPADSGLVSGPEGPFLGVQPGIMRPDSFANLVQEQRPAKVSVDKRESECSSYACLGYECVEYYQCRDGHIITDGEGLIDIRFGATPAQDSAILDPTVSKCPGQLEVCCKDPDHVDPPPAPRHQPKCGTRHQNGLFANVQNQGKSDTQFGEWPHMCAILLEREVATPYGG